jgi:Bacterial protein of unknown function (DUF853)
VADLLLGRTTVPEGQVPTDETVATDDLVTHGVIVGMTGSGKTGLGVVLIEECLAAGVPVLLIDPKGDLTNLALVFPSLAGPEFEPWVDPGQAKADGSSLGEFAEKQATLWRDGLGKWDIDGPQLQTFKDGFDVAIFTPGSNAGIPLNVLGSLSAPATTDSEVLADEIEGYVTSLLNVVGISADPLSSREHILLSNIIHAAWTSGESIDLPTLLARVQQPPMRKLGVFELDQFFPPKERMAFAMQLNAVLAAPTFQTWITGQPIDIQAMLWTPDGKPRAAVVTTAHLSDEDRQSATSLILSKVVTWMRRQSGTTDLRALLYMDEVAGYLPPTANPPTKKPIMLLMKQARAFGLGVILSTQNPVDVDYKALSNAGTWMIGRLTTERDKTRLLEGMSSAAGDVDTGAISDSISGLAKRQFLLRKAGRNQVDTFGTKWARSYLRGPMTRDQIAKLMGSRGKVAPTAEPAPAAAATQSPGQPPVAVAPAVPLPGVTATPLASDETPVMPTAAVPATYLDPAAPWAAAAGAVAPSASGPRVQAAAAARVMLRYDEARAGVVHDEEYEAIVNPLPASTAGIAPVAVDYDDRDLIGAAPAGVRYALPDAPIDSKTYWKTLERDITDHLVRNRQLQVFANPALKAYSRVGETQEQFQARCREIADGEADKKVAALQSKYATKLRALDTRRNSAAQKAQSAESARSQDMLTSVGSVLGGFLRGRRSASSIGAAARRAQTAASRASAAAAKVDELGQQRADLEAQLADEVLLIEQDWQAKADTVTPLAVTLSKTDVRVVDLRLVWIPVG